MSSQTQHLEGRVRRPSRYVVTRATVLSDGTKLEVGSGVDGDYWGRAERPDVFAPEGTAEAIAAYEALQRRHGAKRSKARTRTAPKARRTPYKRITAREIAEAKREIDNAKLDGELPRPEWLLATTRTFTPGGEVAEMATSTSPIRIHLSSRARADMIADAEECVTHERGGAVAGFRDGDAVRICAARETSSAVRSGVNAMVPDFNGDASWARRMQAMHGEHVRCVGTWHSHPSGNLDSSRADRGLWSALAAETDIDIAAGELHVGLVVGLTGRWRGSAEIQAYVVRRAGGFRNPLICERADVVTR
jgi:proteasome lid subunit RPN8/RPN11